MPYDHHGNQITPMEMMQNVRDSAKTRFNRTREMYESVGEQRILHKLEDILGPKRCVLIRRSRGLGDVLCITPLARQLHVQYDITVDVDVDSPFRCLFDHNPHVRKTFGSYSSDSVPAYEEYDTVIDLNEYVEQFDNLTRHRPLAFARAVEVDIESNYTLDYFVSSEESASARRLLSRIPFTDKPVAYIWDSSTSNRNWALTTHQENIRKLLESCISVVLLSSKAVDPGIQSLRLINLSGIMPIRESAAIMNRCALVITPDTGMFHLASALNKQVLTYFGPFPLQERQTHDKVVLLNNPKVCEYFPCREYTCPIAGDGESPCIKVPAKDLLHQVKSHLERINEIRSSRFLGT